MSQRPFASGRRVVRHVLLALLATAVLPPLMARGLNAQRESQTRRVIDRYAVDQRGAIEAIASTGHAEVACGQGRVPDINRQTAIDRGLAGGWVIHQTWLEALAQSASDQARLPQDAWERCILFRAGGGAASVLLSAGANGLVETPFDGRVAGGDDILVVVEFSAASHQ